jgi:hypothetical protein
MTVEGTRPATLPSLILTDPNSNSGNGPTAPGPTGAFRFDRKFPPSRYSVTLLTLPAGVFVKSIRYGGQDALRDLLDLTKGGDSLDIVLSSKVASVAGNVTNAAGDAAAGVVISVWPRVPVAATDGGAKFTSTDQNGHFEVADLGPGDYYAAAWEEIDPGLLRDTSFLARFSKDAAAVHLDEGGRATADTKVITRERLVPEIAKIQ